MVKWVALAVIMVVSTVVQLAHMTDSRKMLEMLDGRMEADSPRRQKDEVILSGAVGMRTVVPRALLDLKRRFKDGVLKVMKTWMPLVVLVPVSSTIKCSLKPIPLLTVNGGLRTLLSFVVTRCLNVLFWTCFEVCLS